MARELVGLVLAAGAGSRFGGPKALARTADGTPWLLLAVRALRAGGCGRVVVAIGAQADQAQALLGSVGPEDARDVEVVVVDDWERGLSATLRTGLAAAFAAGGDAHAVAIVTVDTPELPAATVRRVVEVAAAAAAAADPDLSGALARATYAGAPGHPVLVGRRHAARLAASLTGDSGAGAYLRAHGAREVPCEDLWDGADVDRPR